MVKKFKFNFLMGDNEIFMASVLCRDKFEAFASSLHTFDKKREI